MPEGLSPQRKPIPPPRLPQGYKPPLPKRPDRILRTGALHLPPPDTAPPPRPPPRLTCTKAKNTAESSTRASSNSPTVQLSTSVDSTRLEAIVESPQLDEDSDAGDGIESSQIVSHSPSPHRCLSPRSPPKWPPPVPQKPKRLSVPNSSDMTSSSEISEAAVIGSNVLNTSAVTFDNEMLKPLQPVATSSAGSSSGEYNHAFEDARSASPNLYTPLPSQPQSPGSAPPKPPRSQLLESKPSPPPHTPESKKSSESPTRYSTPSDILAESLQSSMNISSYSNDHQPYQISSPSKSVSPSLHSLGKQSSQPSISADLANDRTSSCSIEADEDGDNNNLHSDASLLSDSEAIPCYLRASKSPHSDSASISLLDKVVGDPLPTANIHPYFTQTAQIPIINSSRTHPTVYSNDLINFCDEGISVIAERDLSRNEQTTKQVDSNQFNQIRYQFSPMSSSTGTHDEEESHYANLPLLHEALLEKYEANENSIVNDERRLSASSVFKSGIPQPPSSPPPVSVRPTEFGRELRNILDTSIELPDPAEQTSFGLEEGPNGGIWNPGYIGLESYRKLVEASQQYIPKKQPATETATNTPRMKSTGTVMSSNFAGRRSESDEAIDGVGTEEIVADGESICLSGYLHVMFNKKDRGKHWSVLRSNQLTFYANEDEVDEPLYGPYDLSTVTYVGRSAHSPSVINVYLKENAMCLHWNHLKLTTEDERAAYWVLLLAKCFMPNDDTVKYTVRNVDAAGRVWIRQGATCPWSKGWMHLYKRRLFYVLDNCAILFELDVRKFIAMKTDVAKVDWCASVIGSQKGPFLLTQDGSSLYVQSECDSITTLWCEVISNQMQCVGAKIEDHKLTADDIPIIVDKCIKYISTYGLYQPGLYRRNGSTVEARLLMDELKRDPINVHITPTSDEVVNVVADVLRSFFRHLESPLIPCYMQERLFAIAEIKDSSRLDEYHEVLMSLPRVRLQTLRRLLDHLKDVTEHANANLASIENIAQIFGPTIFAVDKNEENREFRGYDTMGEQSRVLRDLILHYTTIFRVSLREMHAKSKIDMIQGKAGTAKARADGFLVPIHLFEKDSYTFNVQSTLTAEQVCEAARSRPCFRDEASKGNFALFEMIKCGQLQRRVGLREKMKSMVTGRWLDWDPTDCFLLFKRDPQPFSFDQMYPFADDVKIAEPGSKSFSTAHLKLETGTTIVHYNKSMKQLNEWHVDDVLWFMDHETARKPPTSFTLTFILTKKSFKFKSKFIGYCIAFRDNNQRVQWLNSVLSSQLDFQALPSPLLQI